MRREGLDYGEDLGDAALTRPSTIVDVGATGGKAGDVPFGTARRYRDECMIDALNNGGQITDRQWRAGIMFRQKWLSAFHHTSSGSRYEPRIHSAGGSGLLGNDLALAEQLIDAEDAVKQALAGMLTAEALAVQAVAGEDERPAGRLPALRDGLDWLILFYAVPDGYQRR